MAVEAIDWINPPSFTDAEDGGQNYNLGCRFTLDSDQPCPGVRWRVPDTVSAPTGGTHIASVWSDEGGGRLALKAFTPTPGGEQDILFDTPINLLSGVNYLALVFTVHYTARNGGYPYSSPSGVIDTITGVFRGTTDPDDALTSNTANVFYISPLIGTVDASTPIDASGTLNLPAFGSSGTLTLVNNVDAALSLPTMSTGGALAIPVALDAALLLPPLVAAATLVNPITLDAALLLSPLAAAATLTSDGVAPTPTAPNGWRGLQAIMQTAREQRREDDSARPVACPNDGEPLLENRGVLYCPYDGWKERG